ncbi:DUF1016 family protein [Pedobacter sp. SD-b]|uniref:DUF1016 family protein n=1 Tax=Pedobacter segetis TaxID=2793069 RepID=A0ABS1BMW8_9SPHI|nr:PDDEXK nuclease domain-containing protein [Pedobacter segetis]MBK0384244.1 DUF1016 family protein [Pedobacter segetis]
MQSLLNPEYKNWLIELKSKIRSTQIKAALAVNSSLIGFYWELGKSISEMENVWGNKLIAQVSKDLKHEFPDIKGVSRSNLFYCKKFYEFYSSKIVQQVVGQIDSNENITVQQSIGLLELPEIEGVFNLQKLLTNIPWGHHIIIFTKANNIDMAIFYLNQTLENNWSRAILEIQISSDLYKRQGKSINNFSNTLPKPLSDLANQTLKDPYIFDFLSLDVKYRELDIERQLIEHITKFLLELGKGFAFIGNQYHLQIADNDYYLDLLFYHIKLRCYVVIELKNTKFIPEFTGKLNFYLSAVDSMIKDKSDNPSIGILLCKDKNNIEAEFALRDMNKPMGISELRLVENLPDNLKSSLPTIQELEDELKKLED